MVQENTGLSDQEMTDAHTTYLGSWEMDLSRMETYWSDDTYRIFGISQDQYNGTYEGFLRIIHPHDRDRIDNVIQNELKMASLEMEYRIIKPDDSICNILHKADCIFDQDGNQVYLFGTIQDITDKKELQDIIGQTQETIHRIQKRFQVLVQESSDVFEIIVPDGTIHYISPAIERIMGYQPEERIGRNALEYLEKENQIEFQKMIESVIANPGQRVTGDFGMTTRFGKKIFLALTMSNQLSESSIQGIVINWRDVTERVESQKEIEYIATHDELTKLPNNIYLKKKMSQFCEEYKKKQTQESFALIMMDIDGFKYINDALGYQLGDQLIINVAERLKGFLSEGTFVSRYSGDQFALIIPGSRKSEEYESVVKELSALFREAFKVGMYELDITISLGISIFPDDEKETDQLINYANVALLRAKNEGRNQYQFYSSDIGVQIYKQVVLRNDLLKAIERNQFQVYYQAQVNLRSNDILAAEALIRWEHPEWGMVTPNEFISLAEETGYIVNIGNWMLREVCSNYKKWMEEGLQPIKVSVNYSSIQFFERNFVDNIKNIIDEYDLDPHFLIMEITESVLMKNAEKAIVDIKRLQNLGIQVALDDFGTGFSCLAYLNSLSIDILKIDRSFIKNVLLDDASTIITKSVIDMAQELKIKLVAEGIENWEQLSYLRDLNCFSGQGFLYNKPVPNAEFEALLAKEKCLPEEEMKCEKHPGRNKRKFLRIRLPNRLEADMRVVDVPGQKFKVDNMKVDIKNIGARGMCFASNVRLPVNKTLTLQFVIPDLGEDQKIYGYPVWVHEMDDHCYEYGIEFSIEPREKTDLAIALYSMCREMYNYH